MDYSKIKYLQRSNKVSEVGMGDILGISGPGFTKMMINKTCTVEYLEKIADHFKKPITYFFDREEKANEVSEPGIKYFNCPECIKKQKTIDELTTERDLLRVELLEIYRSKKGQDCG